MRFPSFFTARGRAVRACAALIASLPAVIVLSSVATEVVWPNRIDPDYTYRNSLLAKAVARSPGHHVALIVGSSRTAHGIRPELASPATDARGRPVLWFNFSHVGYGPVMNRVVLGRMARDGIRADTILLEINPTLFTKEDNRFMAGHVSAAEVPTLGRYASLYSAALKYFVTRPERVKAHRYVGDPLDGVARLGPLGGWTHYEPDPESDANRPGRLVTQKEKFRHHQSGVQPRPAAVAALRDSVAIGRELGAEVILFRSPEGPAFQSWYNPEKLAAFDRWLTDFAATERVRVLDARDWLGEDGFNDSHHPNRRGACALSKRLIRDVSSTLGR